MFALRPGRPPGPRAWTEPGSDDAWLVLDRNADGAINDGAEMFGDMTAQPEPAKGEVANGFLALAQHDNGDQVIDDRDEVFPRLRVWQDKNHDAISQPEELHTLPDVGVAGISVAYSEARRPDGHGNLFRYRAPVYGTAGSTVGMTAWDVLLTSPTASELEATIDPQEDGADDSLDSSNLTAYEGSLDTDPLDVQDTGDEPLTAAEGPGDTLPSYEEFRDASEVSIGEEPAGALCIFFTDGDNVHISSTPPEAASGHGWWRNGNCDATLADVTVQLQVVSQGAWLDVGSPGKARVRSGGGSGNRATGRVNCVSLVPTQWRSLVDVDLVDKGDDSDKGETPPRNLNCSPFPMAPPPMCPD